MFVEQSIWSTEPTTTDISIYQKYGETYALMGVPIQESYKEYGYIGYDLYILDVSESKVTVGNESGEWSTTFDIAGEELITTVNGEFRTDELYRTAMEQHKAVARPAWFVWMEEYEGSTILKMRMIFETSFRTLCKQADLTVIYEEGEWEVLQIEVVEGELIDPQFWCKW